MAKKEKKEKKEKKSLDLREKILRESKPEKKEDKEKHKVKTKYVIHLFKMDYQGEGYYFDDCLIFKGGKDAIEDYLNKKGYMKRDKRWYKKVKGKGKPNIEIMAEIRKFKYIK